MGIMTLREPISHFFKGMSTFSFSATLYLLLNFGVLPCSIGVRDRIVSDAVATLPLSCGQ